MRINFICPPANMSGGVRVIGIHAQHLMRMGHDVCLILPPPQPLPTWRKFQSWARGKGWPQHSSVHNSHLRDTRVPHLILDRQRPVVDQDVPDADVVVATWWETAEWVAALSPSKGAKVYFIQGHEIFPHLPIERVRATYRLPLHKVVVSQWLQDVMLEQYDDDIVDIVPNSVDRVQFFAHPRGKQTVPTVGFLHSRAPLKGLDLTLAAIEEVRKRIPNLRVVSFGGWCRDVPAELPKDAEYHFSPPQDELRNLYARCDAWITSSRSEGFNLPALEAMACRTPVVSTRVGWPEEAIKTGWNGALVDLEDVDGLTRGLEWVLSLNDHEWRSVSDNAYATASSGSWEKSAAMFEKALIHGCRRSALADVAAQSSPPAIDNIDGALARA